MVLPSLEHLSGACWFFSYLTNAAADSELQWVTVEFNNIIFKNDYLLLQLSSSYGKMSVFHLH